MVDLTNCGPGTIGKTRSGATEMLCAVGKDFSDWYIPSSRKMEIRWHTGEYIFDKSEHPNDIVEIVSAVPVLEPVAVTH